jgi:hypothetical protein
MSRCKACGVQYKPRINKLTGKEEDLCTKCLLLARLAARNLEDDGEDPEVILQTLDMEYDND